MSFAVGCAGGSNGDNQTGFGPAFPTPAPASAAATPTGTNAGAVTGAAGAAAPAVMTPATPGAAQPPVADAGDMPAGDEPAADEPTPGAGDSPLTGESSCLADITDFAGPGPFSAQSANEGLIKIWVPMVPAGCKVPVLHLANGTGGTCGSYQRVLDHFASHGFLTTCYESGQTGAGTQGVMAIETAIGKYPELASKAIGSTGHSQGGQAAFTVLQQAEEKWGVDYTYAGLAMEPASGFGAQPPGGSWQSMYEKIKSPMFMFSGTSDGLVSASWVARGFAALSDTVEAYNWSAVGATHIPTPQSETMEVGVPWFRWKLLGDNAACEAFKALPSGDNWNSVEEQNVAPCM